MRTNRSLVAAVAASALFFIAAPIMVAGDTADPADDSLQQERLGIDKVLAFLDERIGRR